MEAQDGPFDMNELLDHLKFEGVSRRSKTSSRVIDILHESSLTLSRDDETFFPRQSYFRGASFMVSLTPVEIEQKILIPGHRFSPFLLLWIEALGVHVEPLRWSSINDQKS
jgi:hypothetical protein